jgi:carboxymethylenebutenolidase
MTMGSEIRIQARDGGDFAGYLALPATLPAPNTKAPGIVLLPEVFNTNDHIRSVCDGYAEEGFVVLAPDVYWRQDAASYLPYTDEGRARAQALRAELDTDQFARDLEDTIGALRSRDDCTGKIGVMGFCLGGKFTYISAVRHQIEAAVSYYGVQIDEHLDEADALKCPLLMHFAETDPHVPAEAVAAIQARMGDWDRIGVEIYPGTEHGFNRYGYPPHNPEQAAIARTRTLEHFRRLLAS